VTSQKDRGFLLAVEGSKAERGAKPPSQNLSPSSTSESWLKYLTQQVGEGDSGGEVKTG